MSVQTSYSIKQKPAYDGLKADMNRGNDVSKTVETAAIEFGRVVSEGSTNEKVVTGAGAVILGILARELELEGGTPQVGARVDVRTEGPIYALVDGAGSKSEVLKYDTATGRLTTADVAGTVIAITNGNIVLSNDKADETLDVDNIVRVELVGIAG